MERSTYLVQKRIIVNGSKGPLYTFFRYSDVEILNRRLGLHQDLLRAVKRPEILVKIVLFKSRSAVGGGP